jgi:hypothetical protein
VKPAGKPDAGNRHVRFDLVSMLFGTSMSDPQSQKPAAAREANRPMEATNFVDWCHFFTFSPSSTRRRMAECPLLPQQRPSPEHAEIDAKGQRTKSLRDNPLRRAA